MNKQNIGSQLLIALIIFIVALGLYSLSAAYKDEVQSAQFMQEDKVYNAYTKGYFDCLNVCLTNLPLKTNNVDIGSIFHAMGSPKLN